MRNALVVPFYICASGNLSVISFLIWILSKFSETLIVKSWLKSTVFLSASIRREKRKHNWRRISLPVSLQLLILVLWHFSFVESRSFFCPYICNLLIHFAFMVEKTHWAFTLSLFIFFISLSFTYQPTSRGFFFSFIKMKGWSSSLFYIVIKLVF